MSVLLSDINKIELTRNDYENLENIVRQYQKIISSYSDTKQQIKEAIKQEDSNGFLWFKNKQIVNLEEKQQLQKQLLSLKENRNKLYYEIRNHVAKLVSMNPDYEQIYGYYLDCRSFNEEVYSNYKYNIRLIKDKRKIDKFFNKLSYHLENNIEISEEDLLKFKTLYSKVIVFLKKVYQYKENKSKLVGIGNFEFNPELDISDAYTVLSIISLLYTTIINPIYNEHKDTYVEYTNKKEFVSRYNKRINFLTERVLKM